MNSESTENMRKILIIEDDRFVAEMYNHALMRNDYQIEMAFDGESGFDKLKTGEFDLVLLDIMLPDIWGDEILQKWREIHSKATKTRIIILTNTQQDEISRSAIEADVDAYLIKADITPRRLREIIAEILLN